MKNKTLRTNSMKLKKVIAASLAISVLFAFTGCGNSSSTDNTNTKQESSSTTETGSADELNKKRDDLYQQENQLFADHKDAWDKAFGLMNKNSAGESLSENYADVLAGIVESNKDSFTEEEYDTLCKDIETIRGIEEEIAAIASIDVKENEEGILALAQKMRVPFYVFTAGQLRDCLLYTSDAADE